MCRQFLRHKKSVLFFTILFHVVLVFLYCFFHFLNLWRHMLKTRYIFRHFAKSKNLFFCHWNSKNFKILAKITIHRRGIHIQYPECLSLRRNWVPPPPRKRVRGVGDPIPTKGRKRPELCVSVLYTQFYWFYRFSDPFWEMKLQQEPTVSCTTKNTAKEKEMFPPYM